MNPTGTQQIDKLNDDNYEAWKLQMRSILICNELWPYVNGTVARPTDASEAAAWAIKDGKALALIILSVRQNQLSHIKKAETSKQAWDELECIHKSKGPVRKAALYKQLYQMKKKPNETMAQHVREFLSRAEQLEEAGIALPSELQTIMLLNSLPVEYENFCVAVESRDDLPMPEILKIKLIEEEARRHEQKSSLHESETDENDALMARAKINQNKKRSNIKESEMKQMKPQRFEGKCFNCSKFGHRAAECRNKKKNPKTSRTSRGDAMNTTALSAYSLTQHEWCLDSGATTHMCNDREKFVEIDESAQYEVQTAATDIVQSAGVGTVNINVRVGNIKSSIKLQNVMFIPELRNNLISVPRITENDYSVTFKRNFALVRRKDGTVALKAERRGRLYVVKSADEAKAMTMAEKQNDSLMRWHQRYGHLNVRDLKKLQSDEMVIGMKMKIDQDDLNCEVCAKGKIHQLPFKASNTREKETLALVHTDICGPMSTESLGGSKYFVTFIDDKTRYTEVKMLKNRSSVLEEFKKFKRRVENETGHTIKRLRSDNAKEYISREFTEYLEREGISRQLSVEYTPQQNGVAERANRTLVEMARCMLIQSGLPQSLWAEAINTAAFIRNRCPTKALDDKTPIEMWNNKKPYVGFMRIFGSKVIALEKRPGRGKFEPKGREYVMVGYSEESKAYRLWDQESNKVIKKRDVKFIEDLEKEIAREKDVFDSIPLNVDIIFDQCPASEQSEEHTTGASSRENQTTSENPVREDLSDEELNSDQREHQTAKRGRGRPSFQRTGKPGRPRKVYREAVNFACEEPLPDPLTLQEAMDRADKDKWLKAMKSEYDSLMENETWDLVERPKDRKVLSNKWVFRIKRDQNGTVDRYKARLVARGYEQKEGIDYEEVFAPVARYETIRTFLAGCVENEMHIHQMDVVTAYVQGDLAEEIYMEQPDAFKIPEVQQKVCKLKRPLYGLKQAGREWYKKLDGYLQSIGMKRTEADPCLYVKTENKTKILIVVYVDDLLLASNDLEKLIALKTMLKENFKMKDLGEANSVLGINIKREGATGKLRLTQERYVNDLLRKFNMENSKPVATPLDSSEKLSKELGPKTNEERKEMTGKPYRELVGGLIYLANATRPDIAFAASTLSRFCADPGISHWKAAKRVLRYLRGTTEYGISYEKCGKQMLAYADSDWAGDIDDRKSCSGSVVMLANGPISWDAKKQKSVALSTMEAEYMSLSEVTKEVIYLRKLLSEMFVKCVCDSTIVFCDNQSAIQLTKNCVHHGRSKHIDIRYHFSREAQEEGEISVAYIPSNQMMADVMTKPLPKVKHQECIKMMGLCD